MDVSSDVTSTEPDNVAASDGIASELILSWSIEMSARNCSDARTIAELLPRGTAVYINHLPRHTLDDTLYTASVAHDAGLEPVPHVAARRIADHRELDRFVTGASRAGVRKLLLLGGDRRRPAGPYESAAALMRAVKLADHGITEVGFAGFPEGHPHVQTQLMSTVLQEKLELADRQGLGAYVVTQFCFTPSRIVHFCNELQRWAPQVAVYVGVPGPVTPMKLFYYAQRCGVGATLRVLESQGLDAMRLFAHRDPGKLLTALAQHVRTPHKSNVVGVHVFSFGQVEQSAQWINAATQYGHA